MTDATPKRMPIEVKARREAGVVPHRLDRGAEREGDVPQQLPTRTEGFVRVG